MYWLGINPSFAFSTFNKNFKSFSFSLFHHKTLAWWSFSLFAPLRLKSNSVKTLEVDDRVIIVIEIKPVIRSSALNKNMECQRVSPLTTLREEGWKPRNRWAMATREKTHGPKIWGGTGKTGVLNWLLFTLKNGLRKKKTQNLWIEPQGYLQNWLMTLNRRNTTMHPISDTFRSIIHKSLAQDTSNLGGCGDLMIVPVLPRRKALGPSENAEGIYEWPKARGLVWAKQRILWSREAP